jgi:hypothetical protein
VSGHFAAVAEIAFIASMPRRVRMEIRGRVLRGPSEASGRFCAPLTAPARVGRPQMTAGWALQVDEGAFVA